METYRGLVLAQRSAGERGRFIDVLTEQNTVREIFVRCSGKNNSAAIAPTQPFFYGKFSVRQQKERYYLDSAEPIRIFYRLRDQLSRLSLASYFSELVRCSVREFQNPDEACDIMRLMLNTLHYLETGSREELVLKSIFELRLMTNLGMMPDLLVCRGCGAFLPEQLYFLVEEGCFFCTSCELPSAARQPLLLRSSVLQAMRHILFADDTRVFNFQLGAENLAALNQCTELFVQYHLNARLDTLQFYHAIAALQKKS